MPGMPEVMAKPKMLERLDAVLNDRAARNRFMKDLRSGRDLLAVAIDHGIARTAAEKRHLREEWFRKWWPTAQAHPGGVQAVMREGLIVAIEQARRRRVLVDCYWVCDAGHAGHPKGPHGPPDGEVEVTVSWSKNQATFILQTPHPPRDTPHGRVKEPIWVVRRMPDHKVGRVRASRPAERAARRSRTARRRRVP